MRDGFGQVHGMVFLDLERGFLIDDAFVQPRQRRDNLDGGAWLVRTLISQLLVHHRKDAPGVRIRHDYCAALWAQRHYRRAAGR